MDINKSLYMKEFMDTRSNVGSVHNPIIRQVLFTNLYDELLPRYTEKKVEKVIKEIKEKTIHLLKKDDQSILSPTLPELDNIHVEQGVELDVYEGNPLDGSDINEGQEIYDSDTNDSDTNDSDTNLDQGMNDIDPIITGGSIKTISINSNYISK